MTQMLPKHSSFLCNVSQCKYYCTGITVYYTIKQHSTLNYRTGILKLWLGNIVDEKS